VSTLLDLRSALRLLLNDAAAAGYLWSDGQLNRFINDAVKAVSVELPREAVAEVVTVAGQGEYALPAGLLRVVRVWDVETGSELVEAGDAYGYGYRVFGGKLRLLPVPAVGGRSYLVDCLEYHQELAQDGAVCTVGGGDEELVLMRAAAMAVTGLGTDEAKRRRFEERAGQASGTAAVGYLASYAAGVAGRKRVVRPSSLARRSVVGGGLEGDWS